MSNIPSLVEPLISPRGKETLRKVREFIDNEIIPASSEIEEYNESHPWQVPPKLEELKAKAKAAGLWNLFLPKYYAESGGYTNLEYALMAKEMGRGLFYAEVFNCGAPDTGNMEVLAKYGNAEQKKQWLEPLLNGAIRSAFCMTEKGVASSDATNIRLSMQQEGSDWILNGTKWWASGAGDPRCKLLLVMGKTSPSAPSHKQQSVFIVPASAPGVQIVRPMSVMGYNDAPHGHMEIKFTNVRVPAKDIVLAEGRGFEIIQGRLGPGRIHHCMRTLGAAEQALELMIQRVSDPARKTFGKLLGQHGTIANWIAQSRIEIDEGLLLVLQAAQTMDSKGPKAALEDIAKAKIACPNIALTVIDRAMQAHGAEGLSQDQPLARQWATQRTLRIADGPDEVHLAQLARRLITRSLKNAKL